MQSPFDTILDIRPILAKGGCPFELVTTAAAKLALRESLTFIAPFEPIPLYQALAQLGMASNGKAHPDGAWVVTVTRVKPADSSTQMEKPSSCQSAGLISPVVLMDLRDLPPPEPMVRALEQLEKLTQGQALIAQTRFCPVHLHDILKERGLRYESIELDDGSWETTIVA